MLKSKNDKVKKISFDVHGGLTAKVSDPKARKSFAARHKCDTKKDKTTAIGRVELTNWTFIGGKTYLVIGKIIIIKYEITIQERLYQIVYLYVILNRILILETIYGIVIEKIE
jgi:flagellar hook assembly protein FlgD